MYKTVLVKDLIEDGENLLRKLDEERFPITAAFWYYSPDRMRWRLFIATSLVESKGPLHAYTRIRRALSKMQDASLSLDDISVVSPLDNEFKELWSQVEDLALVSHLERPARMRDVVFEDGYVYRSLSR